MKTRCAILLLTLGFCSLTFSQVKIGDNPQTLHPASLLELEGDSRALVITRVTNAQMLGIQPLNGALVYNTDANCVFYFDGGQWVDLCSGTNTTNVSLELVDSELVLTDSDGNTVSVTLEGAVTQSITNDALVYPAPTIELTVTGNNYNFEVGQITGENIVNSSINGFDDIQPATVTENELAPDSVGEDELQNDAVTTAKIDDGTIVVAHFSDLGATTAGQVLKWNGVNWVPDTDLTGAATLNNGQLFIGDATNIPVGQTMTGDATITNDGEITIEDNAVEANMINGNIVGDGLNQNASGALEIIPGNTANQILKWDGDSWELGTDLTGATTLNDGHIFIGDATNIPVGQTMTGDATIANNGLLTIAPDAVEASMIDPNVAGNGLAQNVTTGALELLPGNAADQILKWNNGTATWELAADQTGAGVLNNGQIFIGDPTNVPVGQTMTGDASIANDGTLTIEPDAVEATMINPNVAGNGLAQNITTGALELLPGNAADQILKWNNGTATWELGTDLGGTIENLATENLTQDAEPRTYNISGQNLFFTNGNIGIGALGGNPQSQLDVNGQIQARDGFAAWEGNAGNPGYGFFTNGDTDTGMFRIADDQLGFTTGGTQAMEVDATQSVIINQDLELEGSLTDNAGATGNLTQVLTADGAGGVTWEDNPAKTSGTPGSIFFAEDTPEGEATEDNINLFWNNDDKVLGIGTNTPNTATQLHINRAGGNQLSYGIQLQNADGTDSGGSATGMLFSVEGASNFGKGALAYERTSPFGRGDLHFLQNSANTPANPELADAVMTIKNNGQIGMGTTDPNARVHITEDAGNTLSFALQLQNEDGSNGGGSATAMLFSVEEVGNFGKGALAYERNASFGRGDFYFLQNSANSIASPTLADAVMTISNEGNIGIGTTAPNTKLHVNEAAGNKLDYGLQLQNADGNDSGGSATAILFSVEGLGSFGKGALAYERNSAFGRGDFHFLQNIDPDPDNPDLADAVMTIKNDGKVGIGTTAPNSILETSGSFSASIIATTANLTLDETNYTVILGGNHTVTLPAANSCQGRIYILKNTTAFTPGISNYFDSIGTLANTIPLGVTQLQSDGTNWQQIN